MESPSKEKVLALIKEGLVKITIKNIETDFKNWALTHLEKKDDS